MQRLIVHVPDLEYFPGGAEALPAEVAKLLARADRRTGRADALLADLLGLDSLPAAGALSRLDLGWPEEPDRTRCWLRFDALGMVPDLTSVWLERRLRVEFDSSAMRELTDELQAMFEAQQLDWRPSSGSGWGVLGLDAPPQAEFRGLDEVVGSRLDEVLPSGPDAARWRSLINESQMIFHQLRGLARADQRGAGLWFWGPGVIPEAPASRPVRIVASGADAILRGLAVWLGADSVVARSFPEVGDGEGPLVLRWPLSGPGDPDAALRSLYQRWLAPASGRVVVDLIGANTGWRLRPRDRWRVWRRSPPAGFVGQDR